MPATHSPMPARAWIVRLARVCWERKTLSIIVIVASVSTILLAALTPLITRQAVNDAIAGDTTHLPLLACGLILIALFDFYRELRAPRLCRRTLAVGSAYVT